MPATTARRDRAAEAAVAHVFYVTWEPETDGWGVTHADRPDLYTQGDTLAEARHNAVEVVALVDDIDEADVGPVRFVVDGPVEVA